MKKGRYELSDVFVGTYKVEQILVSRYVAGNARNVSHAVSLGINADITILGEDDVEEVVFPYSLCQCQGFSHIRRVTNRLYD